MPFRFCCDRYSLFDKPVLKLNQSSTRWIRKKVPLAARRKPIRVISYASTPGSCQKNQTLSQRRAQVVASTLRQLGFSKISVESCGETGPKDAPLIIDESPYWQRVDVVLPKELVTFRVAPGNDATTLSVAAGTKIKVMQDAKKVCQYRAQTRSVDLVIAIDTSGSMSDDWTRTISPFLGAEATKLVKNFKKKGVDAQVFVYTLNYNLCGALSQSKDVICSALRPNQLPTCNRSEPEESWGTATSWIAKNHPWRPGTMRAVLPISDELPCEGNSSSSPEEDQTAWKTGIRDALAYGLKVYPYYGTLYGGYGEGNVVAQMMRIMAQKTGGQYGALESMGTEPLSKVFSAISESIEAEGTDVTLSCYPIVENEEVHVQVIEPGADTAYTALPREGVNPVNNGVTPAPAGESCRRRVSCKDYKDKKPNTKKPYRNRHLRPHLDCNQKPTR